MHSQSAFYGLQTGISKYKPRTTANSTHAYYYTCTLQKCTLLKHYTSRILLMCRLKWLSEISDFCFVLCKKAMLSVREQRQLFFFFFMCSYVKSLTHARASEGCCCGSLLACGWPHHYAQLRLYESIRPLLRSFGIVGPETLALLIMV